MDSKDAKSGSNGTMVLWATISVGLWLIAPDRFTSTDGPAGVLTMVVIGLIGLFAAVGLSGVIGRMFKGE